MPRITDDEERDNPTYPELDAIMTASEAAQMLGFAEATVRQAINRKSLPARKSGGTWLVRREDIETKWSDAVQNPTVWRGDWNGYTEYVLEDGRTIWQIEQPGGSSRYFWKDTVDDIYEHMSDDTEWLELDDDDATFVIEAAT